MLETGKTLRLTYPQSTHLLATVKTRRVRTLTVHKVVDLVTNPLTVDEFLNRPFIRRSRFRIRAFDHTKRKHRQFYLGSSVEFSAPGNLRIALYRPDKATPHQILFREFAPTPDDRRMMIRLLRRGIDIPEGMQLRICCDDFSIAGDE